MDPTSELPFAPDISLRSNQSGEDLDEVRAEKDLEFALKLQKQEEEAAEQLHGEEDPPQSYILQPGAPPSGMFFGLDGLSDDEGSSDEDEEEAAGKRTKKEPKEGHRSSTHSASPGPVLHVSQILVKSPTNEPIDIRASCLTDGLLTFENLMAKKAATGKLTHSQEERSRLFLGSFEEILDMLQVLINRHLENPEKLMPLLEMNTQIRSVLDQYAEHTEGLAPSITEEPLAAPSGVSQREEYSAAELMAIVEAADEAERERLGSMAMAASFEMDRRLAAQLASEFVEDDAYPAAAAAVEPDPEPEEKEEFGGGFAKDIPNAETDSSRPTREMECPICMDDFDFATDEEFRGAWGTGYSLSCGHIYCQECVFRHFHGLIMEGGASEDMVCPDPTCKHPVTDEELVEVVGPSFFSKFQKFLLMANLRADPNCRWCPKPNCETGIQGGSVDNPHLICPTCETEVCFLCNLEWHPDVSCKAAQKQVQSRQTHTKRGDRWIKRNTRPCPKCGVSIIKSSGCNHMTCGNCKYEFCWICMGHFTGYSHFDSGSCKGKMYHSSTLKKAAIYAGIGVGGVLAFAVALPVAAVALPVYGGYRLIRAATD